MSASATSPTAEAADPSVLPPFSDGLYFGLDEKTYHEDPALGSSDIKALLVSPEHYWAQSPMNPRREKKETAATVRGSAYHKLILEGPEAFAQSYVPAPQKEDYGDDLLVTLDDLKAACKDKGLFVTGSKSVLASRLRDYGYDGPIWDEIEAKVAQAAGDRETLDRHDYDELIYNHTLLLQNPYVRGLLTAGQPEVSVFWTERHYDQDIRFKARFDLLKLGGFVDLKTYANIYKKTPAKAIAAAATRDRHDLQACHYLRGYGLAQHYAHEGEVHGFNGSPAWLEAFGLHAGCTITFIYQETGGAPVARPKEFDQDSAIISNAKLDWEGAVRLYAVFMSDQGQSVPWINETPPSPFEDRDFQWVGS